MSVAYVHLSDIHFGQEKGGKLFIHNDVKERLLEDVAKVVSTLSDGRANGVIVTGDVAYSGQKQQYTDAGEWLDRVTKAAKCKDETAVQVVPGNHDIDRSQITSATKLMLEKIAEDGEDILDKFLESELDRELLYTRFLAYRPFAEAYNCPLDNNGGGASDRKILLAPNRWLRFIGLNTALICSDNDQEGKLILGARQRVLPIEAGQELVILAHHPLHWLQDSEDALRFVKSRARVFISGHEHNPSVAVEKIENDCDLMMLAAGATVPPVADDLYTYTYNILEFDWCKDTDSLKVTVHPRAWSDDKKTFEPDLMRLGGKDPCFTLGCPNFKNAKQGTKEVDVCDVEKVEGLVSGTFGAHNKQEDETQMSDQYALALLHFFRDLSPAQRMAIFVKLGAIPNDWSGTLTQAIERRMFDNLDRAGRIEELIGAIKDVRNNS